MSYLLSDAELSRLRGRLTRAEGSGDPNRVLAECDDAFAIFDAKGYPDGWERWDEAYNTALIELDDARDTHPDWNFDAFDGVAA